MAQSANRDRLLSATVSVTVHLALLVVVVSAWKSQPRSFQPPPMEVSLVELAPPPVEAPKPIVPTPTPPGKPPPRRSLVRPTPAPPKVAPLLAREDKTVDAPAELSDSDLAGAATAGSGSGGGACDMVRWVQNALRKDRLVQAAVAGAGSSGRAFRVWNGDWVRSLDEDGKGLAAVREAIIWEVAFAPAACRTQPVHGLVLISLNDAPGAPRLVVGSDRWRWSDLTSVR